MTRRGVIISEVYDPRHQVLIVHELGLPRKVLQVPGGLHHLPHHVPVLGPQGVQHLAAAPGALTEGWAHRGELSEATKAASDCVRHSAQN